MTTASAVSSRLPSELVIATRALDPNDDRDLALGAAYGRLCHSH